MFDLAHFQDLLRSVVDAQTNEQKGTSLENLGEYLFGSLDGVEVQDRDIQMGAEEVDLVLWNAQIEVVFRPWDPVILVEAKNWSAPVNAPALDSFISKIRRRALKTGILIAANGVTGNFVDGDGNEVGAAAIIRSALQEGIRVIVITMDDLRGIQSTDDLRTLIKRRYCGLYVHRVF